MKQEYMSGRLEVHLPAGARFKHVTTLIDFIRELCNGVEAIDVFATNQHRHVVLFQNVPSSVVGMRLKGLQYDLVTNHLRRFKSNAARFRDVSEVVNSASTMLLACGNVATSITAADIRGDRVLCFARALSIVPAPSEGVVNLGVEEEGAMEVESVNSTVPPNNDFTEAPPAYEHSNVLHPSPADIQKMMRAMYASSVGFENHFSR
jgi:hypothetical protein